MFTFEQSGGLRGWIVASALLLTGSLLGACQDQTECAPGTVLSQGACVPLQQINCDGPGVRYVGGRCVPNFDEVCGPGTVLSEDGSTCISAVDASVAIDLGGDQNQTDVVEDTAVDGETPDLSLEIGEVEEDESVVVLECDSGLDGESKICVRGVVLNFLDNQPVLGDSGLVVEVKDLVEAAGDPNAASLAQADVVSGGQYIMPGFDPPQQMLFIVGEADPTGPTDTGDVWQRTLGGLVTHDGVQTEYENQVVYTVPRAAIENWNQALGLEGSNSEIDITGFALIRVVQDTGGGVLAPVSGATLSCGSCTGVSFEYFADAQLSSFKQGDDSTGPSGMVLVTGTGTQDVCSASHNSLTLLRPTACGTSQFRASVGAVIMGAE
ncbi:MAG: hypothetical protein KC561_03590 [Myxococcales bacterium]|nr:hypothetical protein [Myxococcales bacterium]